MTPSLNQGLTLIQTAKSFIIPKFLSKAALISESVPDHQVKEINKLIYHFIWKGNDKIERSALINDIIIHQTHYEKSDWSRAFNQFTIACELDMINAISAADINGSHGRGTCSKRENVFNKVLITRFLN